MPEAKNLQAPEVVFNALRTMILEGELPGGKPLRQDDLAAKFGTSRIPVREALRQLEAEGLITYHPRRGAVVSTISMAEALEMFDIRIGLECRALRLAIPAMTEQDFALLESICVEYEKCQPTDAAEWGRLNRLFHTAMYAPCDRPRLLAMITDNIDNATRFIRVQTSIAYGLERAQREHRAMLSACRAGDVKLAVRLLEEHIAHAQKALNGSVRHGKIGQAA
jgi:DNA-binding GntR family transcriptional regulator